MIAQCNGDSKLHFCGAHRPDQVMSANHKTRAQALSQRLSVHRSVTLSGTLPSNAGWLAAEAEQSTMPCNELLNSHTHSECNPYTTQWEGIS